jgi:hypothetical protein
VVRLELVRTGSPAARVNIDPLDAVIPEHWPREGCCYRRGLRDRVRNQQFLSLVEEEKMMSLDVSLRRSCSQ